MTRLLIARGLPASGKTTFARKLQPRVVRVNRDDLRLMLHGRRLFTETAEAQITHVQRLTVECLRRDAAGPSDVRVGERTIRRMHDRYIAGRSLPLPVPDIDPDPR